ncbi:hypothetical protein Tco_1410884 [Tanacetum coccineum]
MEEMTAMTRRGLIRIDEVMTWTSEADDEEGEGEVAGISLYLSNSSPLSPWSSPFPLEGASTSHSLPLPLPFILSPTRLDAPSLGIPPPLPISVPTSSPPLLLPSASRREDRELSSSAAAARPAGGLRADYGFVATIDRGSGVNSGEEERLRLGSPTVG